MPVNLSALPKLHLRLLRRLTAIALSLAFLAAIFLIAMRLVHLFRPESIHWNFKSAFPLILIGVAFAFLQFAVPRTRNQIVLGLCVSSAFILWGLEQFISNKFVASSIDDLVVFLFVLDLSLVIYQHLKSNENTATADLPFVPTDNRNSID